MQLQSSVQRSQNLYIYHSLLCVVFLGSKLYKKCVSGRSMVPSAYTTLHGVSSGLLWEMERIKSSGEMDYLYVKALKLLARSCSFGVLEDELIRDRVVCGIVTERVQPRLY